MKLFAVVTTILGAVHSAHSEEMEQKERFERAMQDAFKAFSDNYAEGFPGFLDEVHEEIIEQKEKEVEDAAEFLEQA